MLTDQRRNEIIRIIYSEGKAYISELAQRFNVSGETIRRDLNSIVKSESIKKVHGGAICVKKPLREDSYAVRRLKNAEQKREIGKFAASLVEDNDIIALDTGTDTESFAEQIHGVCGIKIITNSLRIAQILTDKRKNGDFDGKIIMLGGEIDSDTECAYSPLTTQMLSHFVADKAFIGATTVNNDGIMSWETAHGVFTGELCRMAEKTILLADSEKFRKHSFYHICPINEIDMIITDDKNTISDGFYDICRKSGCKIETVQCKGESKND